MMDISSFALATAISINTASYCSSSASFISTCGEPFDKFATGSFGGISKWLGEETASGQKINIINNRENILEKNVEFIKNIFSLNNDELAAALGVTRKTLLSWRKEDSSPKKAQSLKLFNLYVLAKNWKDNNYSTHKSDLDLPVLNGKSIKSMIAEDSLDVDKILFAGNRLSHNILVEDDLF
ncbi:MULTISPECIES: hypothetical protein [Acinetobacter calcoaceticus/baumannii complex]|nr:MULTISPECIES: hypothetical protein [Acinetobacter calcoaceticus/baumannii complex]CAH1079952.1 Uncharacterised protein [Acinetobacter phage MD-2021a]ARG36194.1 hypothetical protein B7L46_15225 [Acinetobacter baumannii]AVN29126.1 hypothetical protein AM467_06725 [Acinetobacter baumannii]EME5680971.1 hypothetical protein [Acinetobacter baumannii]KAA8930127.1 hypothetical protein DLI67_10460 [Acinetobacter baumannii]